MDPRGQILIVDDDASIRATLAEVLDEEGYDVLQAADGREALDLLEERPRRLPSAVILDLNMPVMDGCTCYREMRARGLGVPVVILSAVNAVRVAQDLGATAAMNKPFDIDRLVETVEAIVSDARG